MKTTRGASFGPVEVEGEEPLSLEGYDVAEEKQRGSEAVSRGGKGNESGRREEVILTTASMPAAPSGPAGLRERPSGEVRSTVHSASAKLSRMESSMSQSGKNRRAAWS